MAKSNIKNIVDFFENGINPTSLDKIEAKIDLKTTTSEGILRMLTDQVLFKKDSLQGMTEFKGQVYRVDYFLYDEMPYYQAELLQSLYGQRVTMCKVRIPEVHGMLEIPGTFDLNDADRIRINRYPYYLCDPSIPQKISIGDIVTVKITNTSTYSEGIVINRVSDNPQGQGSVTPQGAVTKKDDLKKLFVKE